MNWFLESSLKDFVYRKFLNDLIKWVYFGFTHYITAIYFINQQGGCSSKFWFGYQYQITIFQRKCVISLARTCWDSPIFMYEWSRYFNGKWEEEGTCCVFNTLACTSNNERKVVLGIEQSQGQRKLLLHVQLG